MKKKVLIIAAHPDDEVLGCGGTAAKHADSGDEVFCLILGEGVKARRGTASKATIKKLRQAAEAAAKIIGFKEIYFFDFPDNSFDAAPLLKIVKKTEEYLKKIKPNIVYTHYENDLNIDHRLTFQAALTACRPCGQYCPEQFFVFETLSSSEWQVKDCRQFAPNVYVDISAFIERKIAAMKKYQSEIRNWPHPRSEEGIKVLARYRGLQAGLRFAEAFQLVRQIG